MEGIQILLGKVVGTPTSNSWAQTLAEENLFGVVQVTGEKAQTVGKDILTKISAIFQDSKQESLATIKEKVVSLELDNSVKLVLVSIKDSVVYLVIHGGGAVFLKRQEALARVLTSEDKVAAGSGYVEDKDLLILTSPQFNQTITRRTLEEILEGASLTEIVEILSTKIHGSSEGSTAACILLAFNKEAAPETSKEKPLLRAWNIIRRYSRGFALVLLAVLILSIVLGVRQKTTYQKDLRLKKEMEQVSAFRQQGKDLLSLNRRASYEAFLSAKKILEEERINAGKNSSREKEITASLAEIDQLLAQAGKIYQVEPVIFFELPLIKSEAAGDKLALAGLELAILDSKHESLYLLNLANKSSKVVAANLSSPIFVTEDTNKFYIFNSGGVEEINKRSGEKKQIIEKEQVMGDIAGMGTFLLNIYMLDKTNEVIHKYIPGEEKFVRKSYLASDIKPDFSTAVDLAIDGAVYVLLSDGTILKYLQGAPKPFQVSGLDLPLSSAKSFFTSSEVNNIYILDSGNNRIVVIDKEGNYQAQYRWEGIKDVANIVVWEKERKILLLTGSKIYLIEIK
ncbi:hypothetical protein HYS29_00660 [Candidatus Microgenomates bacterium]|nr:hypothetical protein [Candidatus Microgenomates bacterium]